MFLLIVFCCGTPPSCLKVMGWVVVAWSNLVSAQGPLVLGLGLKGLGPGLDNKNLPAFQIPVIIKRFDHDPMVMVSLNRLEPELDKTRFS